MLKSSAIAHRAQTKAVDRTRAKRTALGAVKRVAAGVDRLTPARPGVVVLLYHRVGRRSSVEVDLPRSLFAEQMAAVAGRAVALDDALTALARPAPTVGTSPVAVTFDDGTADFVDEAVPVLVEHGVPALLYVATAFIDEGRSFPDAGTPASWSALADAVSTGLVTIGSHTHTHALLDRAAPAEVAEELDRSCRLIEDRLGVAAAHFAYPKAVAGSPEAETAVRARFRSAALAGTRPNRYGATDPYRLARSPIQLSDGMRWFEAKLDGGMALEDKLRQVINRGRYAGAVT
jgi:peptidoglycan/xylan/chitin deacetylase (PgdA/CDA1 family)